MRHSDRLLNIVTSLTAFAFMLIALFFPSASDSMALWVVVASVFVIGIPHGAIDHINEMRDFFDRRGKSLSIAQFYKKATPFTIISILGLAMLLFVNQQLNLENQFLSLMFILISVLTLPHMLIVERMYKP